MFFRTILRAMWLTAAMLLFSPFVNAQIPTTIEIAKVDLQPGEIALEGLIARRYLVIDNRPAIVLKVTAFWLPNGRGQKLPTPRERTIIMAEGATIRTVVNKKPLISPTELGMSVLVVGRNEKTSDEKTSDAMQAREAVGLDYVRTTPPSPQRKSRTIEYSKLRLSKEFQLLKHSVLRSALSPDGRILATCGDDGGQIHLLDVTTGRIRTLQRWTIFRDAAKLSNSSLQDDFKDENRNFMISSLAFSADGKSLYISAAYPLLPVVNVLTGKAVGGISVTGDGKTAVSWDEKTLLFSGGNIMLSNGLRTSIVNINDLTGGFELRQLQAVGNFSCSVAFSRDHKKIIRVGADNSEPFASGIRSGTVEVWDSWSGAQEVSVKIDNIDYYTTKLSPHGKYILGGFGGEFPKPKIARLWGVALQKEHALFDPAFPSGIDGFVNNVDVSEDEDFVSVASSAYRRVKATYVTSFPYQSLDWGKWQIWKVPSINAQAVAKPQPVLSIKANFSPLRVLFLPDNQGLIVVGGRRIADNNAKVQFASVIQVWRVPTSSPKTKIWSSRGRKNRNLQH